jgi:hypothetical protein
MEIGPQTWSRLSQVPALTLSFHLPCMYLRIRDGRFTGSIYMVMSLEIESSGLCCIDLDTVVNGRYMLHCAAIDICCLVL